MDGSSWKLSRNFACGRAHWVNMCRWLSGLVNLVLGNIPVILLHRGIEFIPATLLTILFYWYFINYIFLWLRGGHEVINRVANTKICQPTCMVKVNMHLWIVTSSKFWPVEYFQPDYSTFNVNIDALRYRNTCKSAKYYKIFVAMTKPWYWGILWQ